MQSACRYQVEHVEFRKALNLVVEIDTFPKLGLGHSIWIFFWASDAADEFQMVSCICHDKRPTSFSERRGHRSPTDTASWALRLCVDLAAAVASDCIRTASVENVFRVRLSQFRLRREPPSSRSTETSLYPLLPPPRTISSLHVLFAAGRPFLLLLFTLSRMAGPIGTDPISNTIGAMYGGEIAGAV